MTIQPEAFADAYPFIREVTALIAMHRGFRDACAEVFDSIKGERNDDHVAAGSVVLTEMVRMLNTGEAAIALCLDGYGPQAEMLNRSIFEAAVTAHWVSRHPEETAARYLFHREFLLHLANEARRAHPIAGPVVEDLTMTAERVAEAEVAFGKWGERSWTGESFRQMAEALLASAEGPVAVHVQAYLAVSHPLKNQTMHSSGLNVLSVAEFTEEGTALRFGPWENGVWSALRDVYNLVGIGFDVFASHFHLEADAALRRLVFDAWASFRDPDELASVGRNDPCPCGSTAKYKHCHGSHR